MSGAFIGENKALVFPVMCDAYIKVPYLSHHQTSGTTGGDVDDPIHERIGIYAHQNSFSIQTLVTPYDVNGFGTYQGYSDGSTTHYEGVLTSEKTIPCSADSLTAINVNKRQSSQYLTYEQRKTHKMMLFYNSKAQLYLQNTTGGTRNTPAEYKIVFGVTVTKGATTTETLLSTDAVITARNKLYGFMKASSTDVYSTGDDSTFLRRIHTSISLSGTTSSDSNLINSDMVEVGSKLYNGSGTLVATVASRNLANGVLTFTASASHSGALYTDQPREATYLNGIYKISASFNLDGTMSIFVNGILIKSGKHSLATGSAALTFNFEPEDCFIGQNPNDTTTFTGKASPTSNKVFVDGTSGQAYSSAAYVVSTGSGGTTTHKHPAIAADNGGFWGFTSLGLGSTVSANSLSRTVVDVVSSDDASNYLSTITTNTAVDWHNSGNGYAFTYTVGSGRTTQFMGEIHELVITKGTLSTDKREFNLSPKYDDILIYYRFEGEKDGR